MAHIVDYVLDAALSKLDTEAERVYICSQEPTTYAEAITTYALGNSTSLSVGAPGDRSGGGREVTVAAVADASITGTGTASHFALVDVSNTRLLVTGSLSLTQPVTSGNTFSLDSFTIGIPDPA